MASSSGRLAFVPVAVSTNTFVAACRLKGIILETGVLVRGADSGISDEGLCHSFQLYQKPPSSQVLR